MTLTPSPMKISEAARLAALLNARLVARPGRLELEAFPLAGKPPRRLAAHRIAPTRFGGCK